MIAGPVVAGLVLVAEKHRELLLRELPGATLVSLTAPLETLLARAAARLGGESHKAVKSDARSGPAPHFFNPKALTALFDRNEAVKVQHSALDASLSADRVWASL